MGIQRLSCWLFGADSLLEECGEILLRAGHEVRGVVTASARIAAWARARRMAVLDPADELEPVLARRPFDLLFAITHLALVPDRLLLLPKHSAINFHDGPLPEYAGLNAPAWALQNGETRHGITWHVMTPTLDGGPILKQRSFALAPDETSFSLNAKCFEAALDSFSELLAELAAGTVRARPQDGAQRRVYTRHHRPPAACLLDWSRPAPESEALVRALDFGRYPNPLGLAKLEHGGRCLLVTKAQALGGHSTDGHSPEGADDPLALDGSNRLELDDERDDERDDFALSPPGTVLACDAGEVRVATARGVLALRGFAELGGRALDPLAAAQRLGLAPGVVLDPLAPERARRLSELDQRMSRAEGAWTSRLARLDALTLPLPGRAAPTARARMTALEVALPPELTRRFPDQPLARVLTAAFCACMARLSRRTSFDLGYCDPDLRRETRSAGWISAWLPLTIEVDLGQDLPQLVARLSEKIDAARARGPWLRDLLARRPELESLRARAAELLPVGVELVVDGTAPDSPEATAHEPRWKLELRADGCRFVYDAEHVAGAHALSLQTGFAALLASLAEHPGLVLGAHGMVSPEDLRRQHSWNQTARPHHREVCVHELFAQQVERTPAATALVCDGVGLTYAELDARAQRLADELERRGVRAGQLVGIFVERSVDMVVAMLGTLQAGAAYVPLDPGHPAERLAFVLADAQIGLVVTRARLARALPAGVAELVRLDVDVPSGPALPRAPRAARIGAARPADLCYVIYTSGSTGQPKGVQVEHRNVASFFAAMDERIPHEPPGVWLALTNIGFDISVLELLWPLCRGFEVVVHAQDEHVRSHTPPSERARTRPLDFSLFFFASDEGQKSAGYRLLLEGARFADAHGFAAVWTPERHFHAFGGLYPNPAVTAAALATITQRIQIRAGSIVLPLHHPIRVAEDWALVDNLSNGRVALSFASGWNREDFVLAPHNHAQAKAVMFRDIEVVRRLWRGETLPFPGPGGAPVAVRTLPRPVQPELPVWITTAGNLETYVAAGRIGANVLTHLLGQTMEQLAPKIAAYRQARAQSGFDPAAGTVALMLHTFVGADEQAVRASVRQPLERYLGSSLDLLKHHAWSFPTFHRPDGGGFEAEDDLSTLGSEERAALLAHACERYYETSGLFGTPERCLQTVARLRAIDVDEIACLIDFGVPADEVLASLPLLDGVRRRAHELHPRETVPAGPSLAARILGEHVTHLQCTPSLARILCSDPDVRQALGRVRHVFVGGEALPRELARELQQALGGTLTNMYGPTETTVWSSTHALTSTSAGDGDGDVQTSAVEMDDVDTGTVPIGRPLANTRFHVLDERLQPLPLGVPGELCIAGDGVARGYLARPELDAERFLPEPPSAAGAVAGARMYRSGDLVRYRSDGVLEFLGRIDHQLKIRGQRIEPGEIEAELLRAEVSAGSLSEVVVVAREDQPGDQRLVAYLVPRAVPRAEAPDLERLRARLRARLPESMVPAQFVLLERLPRNPSGKVDRRALPAPEAPTPREGALPASELEARLAELWRETLALEHVGVEDNFFDLGGHSLLIVRLHRRMPELTSKPVSLTDLFRFPTIRALARHLASEAEPTILEEASLRGRRRRKSKPLRQQRALES